MDLPPDQVLEGAVGKLDAVVVVGFDKDGDLYVATSEGEGFARAAWLLGLAMAWMQQTELEGRGAV